MKDPNPEPADPVDVMIPRWVHKRIRTLLDDAQSATEPERYVNAILEGLARRLRL